LGFKRDTICSSIQKRYHKYDAVTPACVREKHPVPNIAETCVSLHTMHLADTLRYTVAWFLNDFPWTEKEKARIVDKDDGDWAVKEGTK